MLKVTVAKFAIKNTVKVTALNVLGDLHMQSRVKWFDNVKGYGFIESPDGKDIFVHYKQITGDGYRTLREGQEVEFNVERGPKGLQASNVTIL